MLPRIAHLHALLIVYPEFSFEISYSIFKGFFFALLDIIQLTVPRMLNNNQ